MKKYKQKIIIYFFKLKLQIIWINCDIKFYWIISKYTSKLIENKGDIISY